MSLYRATRGEGVFIQGHQWMRVSLYRATRGEGVFIKGPPVDEVVFI